MSKEFIICLNEDKLYFPGDAIKGHIKLDLKKSADIQSISLNFKGTVEAHGDKAVLIDQTEILATTATCQKYTTFAAGKIHKFDFEFVIPINKSLPSSAKIPKVANISYFLIATPKKPSFNFSHTLPTVAEEVKILDLIDVNSPDYCRKVNMNNDLGFTNGSKSTQWNIVAQKSAFIRGDNIELECNINNFPPIKKSKAIKVSLIRHVYKTSSAKVVEKKVLSLRTIDLEVTEIASTQSVYINLCIPSDTPASVFPDTGRILSISYVIQAELNMKGVKSSIKLKDTYTQEAAIVIATFPKAEDSIEDRSALSRKGTAIISSVNLASNSLGSNYRNSSVNLPVQQQRQPPKSYHGTSTNVEEVKPLARLDKEENQELNNNNSIRRSYLSRNINNSPTTRSFYGNDEIPPRTFTPTTNRRLSHLAQQSPSPPMIIDRSLTPLPSAVDINGRNTISYANRRSSRGGPVILQPSQNKSVIVSSPHEIGPNDVINRGDDRNIEFSGGKDYFNINNVDNEKVISETNYDEKKEQKEELAAEVPTLIRHDTVSTASTSGGMIDEFLYSHVTPPIINKERSSS